MLTNYLKLTQPDYNSRSNWGAAINNNFQIIDDKMSQFAAQINNKLAAMQVKQNIIESTVSHINYRLTDLMCTSQEIYTSVWNITDFNYTLAITPKVYCNVVFYTKTDDASNSNTAITMLEPIYVAHVCEVDFTDTSRPQITVTVENNEFTKLHDLHVWCEISIPVEGE